MPVWGSLYFQNGVTPVMEQLVMFHDHTMMIMVLVLILVGYLLLSSIFTGFYSVSVREGQELESLWTVMPGLVLLFIAFPSLKLLYLMEENEEYALSVSALGHQWFWTYEYGDLMSDELESYMESEGLVRLLEVSDELVMPYECQSRVVVTSEDVIHSWTVPAMGVSVDAVPGRLNQLMIYGSRPGVYVGECSEICGANHSFMPIVLHMVSLSDFMMI